MTDEIVVVTEQVMLGAIQTRPQDVVQKAAGIATELAKIVNDKKLYKVISGRKHVQVEGWNTLGAMLGILPAERETRKIDNGYEAYVELIRASDGMKVGGASAICTYDEKNWSNRDEYAVRSMAITRATGKAFRLGFSWIMQLAGYDVTPAEEIPHEDTARDEPPAKPERPLTPEALKEALSSKAKKTRTAIADGKAKPCTDNNRKVLAAALGQIFPDNTPRYEFSEWATGTASTREMPGEYVLALLAWLEVDKFEDEPSEMAQAEAIPAHSIAKGQLTLPENK